MLCLVSYVVEVRSERVLRRPEKAGEEGLEASLRRRCRYQLCGTLGTPGRVGRVDGGRFEVSFAIQSDGLSVDSAGSIAHAVRAEDCGCG